MRGKETGPDPARRCHPGEKGLGSVYLLLLAGVLESFSFLPTPLFLFSFSPSFSFFSPFPSFSFLLFCFSSSFPFPFSPVPPSSLLFSLCFPPFSPFPYFFSFFSSSFLLFSLSFVPFSPSFLLPFSPFPPSFLLLFSSFTPSPFLLLPFSRLAPLGGPLQPRNFRSPPRHNDHSDVNGALGGSPGYRVSDSPDSAPRSRFPWAQHRVKGIDAPTFLRCSPPRAAAPSSPG